MATEDRMRTDAATELDGAALARLTEAAIVASGLESRREADARIAEILTMAEEWAAGRLPLAEIGRLTTGQERFLAVRFTRPAPPSLLAMIDALIDAADDPDAGRFYRTEHGVFSTADLTAGGARYSRTEKGVRLLLASGRLWQRRPNPDGATDGERRGVLGEWVHGETTEERREIAEHKHLVPAGETAAQRGRWE